MCTYLACPRTSRFHRPSAQTHRPSVVTPQTLDDMNSFIREHNIPLKLQVKLREYLHQQKDVQLRLQSARAVPVLSPALQVEGEPKPSSPAKPPPPCSHCVRALRSAQSSYTSTSTGWTRSGSSSLWRGLARCAWRCRWTRMCWRRVRWPQISISTCSPAGLSSTAARCSPRAVCGERMSSSTIKTTPCPTWHVP